METADSVTRSEKKRQNQKHICWKTTEKEHKRLQLKAKGPADSALRLISDLNYGIWSWSQKIWMVSDQNIIR